MLEKFVNSLKQPINKYNFAINGISKKCINVGCGSDKRLFWINCDLHPADESITHLDITNASDLQWLENQKSDIIACNHVIGYLTIAQAENFFLACYKSLNLGGTLILEFPDIKKISKAIQDLDYSSTTIDYEYVELIRAIYAYDQEDAMSIDFKLKTYITGWSDDYLIHRLKLVGFTKILIKEPQTHEGRKYRDSRVEAFK